MAAPFVIADAHQDVAWACLKDGRDFATPTPDKALTLPAWQAGGVRLACTTLFSADQGDAIKARAHAMKQCEFYDRLVAANPGAIARATRQRDLDDLAAPGPVRMVHLMEGADAIDGADELPEWKARGVVAVGPVWNTANRYGGGNDSSRGLTPDGFALVRMCGMERIAVDLSHLNPTAFDEALDAAMGPVYASHSNARALCRHRRNLTDEQLKKVGAAGGVVGVVFYAAFLQDDAAGPSSIEMVCRHLTHIGRLIGFERVCLGTDLDGGFDHTRGVEGIPTCAELPVLADALRERRFTDDTIAGILGDNLRRFVRDLLPE